MRTAGLLAIAEDVSNIVPQVTAPLGRALGAAVRVGDLVGGRDPASRASVSAAHGRWRNRTRTSGPERPHERQRR